MFHLDISASNSSFAAACFSCIANGFLYGFAIFSTELKSILSFSSSEAVILGVLSQVGIGAFQLVVSSALARAQKNGRYSVAQLDTFMNLFTTGEFFVSTLAIGIILLVASQMDPAQVEANRSTHLGLLCIFFLLWGKGVGSTQTTAMTIVNFNHQDNPSVRRKRVAMISFSVGLGGVIFVIIYYLGLSVFPLHTTFFSLAVVYLVVVGPVRYKWLRRVKPQRVETVDDTPCTTANNSPRHSLAGSSDEDDNIPVILVQQPPVVAAIPQQQQSVCVLLRSDIVWLTFLGTFVGVGTAGTLMSSIGNLAQDLEPEPAKAKEITFFLLLAFLIAQTSGRLFNATMYAFYDWPYVFACWQVLCNIGIVVFLIVPTTTGAFIAACFIGASFGGFHSSFPVIAATCFPGHPSVDYAQNVGLALMMSSLGCIVVGQVSSAVISSGTIEEIQNRDVDPGSGLYMSFVFFLVIQFVSALLAIQLGRRINQMRKRTAVQAAAAAAQQEQQQQPHEDEDACEVECAGNAVPTGACQDEAMLARV